MKEGGIFMNGQYHNPNEYWGGGRMGGLRDDSALARSVLTLLYVLAGFVVLAAVTGLLLLLTGCTTWKRGVTEKTETVDSARTEYVEKVVRVPVTVYVEVPAETRERETRDTLSFLKTVFAQSCARITWEDSVPVLHHTLENIPQRIAKTDSVSVREVTKTIREKQYGTVYRTEVREKQLAWWQTGLMYIGAISVLLLFIYTLIRFVLRR